MPADAEFEYLLQQIDEAAKAASNRNHAAMEKLITEGNQVILQRAPQELSQYVKDVIALGGALSDPTS